MPPRQGESNTTENGHRVHPALELGGKDQKDIQHAESEELEGVTRTLNIFARLAIPGVDIALGQDSGGRFIHEVHAIANGFTLCLVEDRLDGDGAQAVEVRVFLGRDGLLMGHHIGELDQPALVGAHIHITKIRRSQALLVLDLDDDIILAAIAHELGYLASAEEGLQGGRNARYGNVEVSSAGSGC